MAHGLWRKALRGLEFVLASRLVEQAVGQAEQVIQVLGPLFGVIRGTRRPLIRIQVREGQDGFAYTGHYRPLS